MPSKLTKSEVLKEARQIAKDRDFGFNIIDAWHEVDNSGTRKWVIKIKCNKKDHITEVRLTNWRKKTNKGECKNCNGRDLTDEERIERLKVEHENKYSYDKFKYNGSKETIVATCPEHGDFEIEYTAHMSGNGCKICAGNIPKTGQEIMDILNVTPYCKVIDLEPGKTYHNKEKVKVKCLLFDYHPIQLRPLTKLLNRKMNCTVCSKHTSSYEVSAYEFLYVRDIEYTIEQHIKYDDDSSGFIDIVVKDKGEIFYIEIDGEFHSDNRKIHNISLTERNKYDLKKDSYCKKNNIRLERVHFENLEKRLKEIFPKHKIIKNINNEDLDEFLELFPEKEAIKIHQLKKSGTKSKDIAKNFGMLESGVSKILQGDQFPELFKQLYPNGTNPYVNKRTNHFRPTPEQEEFVLTNLKKGVKQAEIMRRFKRKFSIPLGRGWISKFAGKHNLRGAQKK